MAIAFYFYFSLLRFSLRSYVIVFFKFIVWISFKLQDTHNKLSKRVCSSDTIFTFRHIFIGGGEYCTCILHIDGLFFWGGGGGLP